MWDSLARTGMKRIHGSLRGHCYTSQTPEHYEIFRTDFLHLNSMLEYDLVNRGKKLELEDSISDFAPRILDNYLMLLGKRQV